MKTRLSLTVPQQSITHLLGQRVLELRLLLHATDTEQRILALWSWHTVISNWPRLPSTQTTYSVPAFKDCVKQILFNFSHRRQAHRERNHANNGKHAHDQRRRPYCAGAPIPPGHQRAGGCPHPSCLSRSTRGQLCFKVNFPPRFSHDAGGEEVEW